ncbi:MAG: hypothetical protein R6V47_01090 [Candidatus Delongbacteria bacterium]
MSISNIYIEVLKYGAENLNRGVTYNEAIRHLGRNAPKGDFELYFNNWFYDNFHSEKVPVLKRKQSEAVILSRDELKEANDKQVFLTSSAYFKLMSFSNDGMSKEAIISLIISSTAFVISIATYLFILIRY